MAAAGKSVPLGVEQALAQEYAAVTGKEPPGPAPSVEDIQRAHFGQQTAALCFSGGGIRSAAFALGVSQALAKRGLLKRFHYLSTVSGGGYTGSFLAAWSYRADGGIAEVERELATPRPEPARPEASEDADALRWVRNYSSYLAPRSGFASLDTWTLIVTYLRNLALNWLVLLPLLAAAVCVPFFAQAVITAPYWGYHTEIQILSYSATILGLFILRWRTYSTGSLGVHQRRARYDMVVLPLLLAGAFLAAVGRHSFAVSPAGWFKGLEDLALVVGSAVLAGALSVLFVLLDLPRRRQRPWRDRLFLFGAFAVSALLSAYAAQLWTELFPWERTDANREVRNLALVLLGPPAWLGLLLLPEVLFLALAGSLADDHDREWWARNVAVVFWTAAVWIVGGAVVLLGPLALAELAKLELASALPARVDLPALIGSIAALLGALIARRGFIHAVVAKRPDAEQGTQGRRRLELALNLATSLVIVAIFAGFAFYVGRLLQWMKSGAGRAWLHDWTLPVAGWEFSFAWAGHAVVAEMLMLGLFLGTSLLLGIAVHVNRYSLHAMYRDRLIRTFLAATRRRRPVPQPILASMAGPPAQPPGLVRRLIERVIPVSSDPPVEVWQFTGRRADRFTDFDRHDNPLLQWLLPTRRGGSGLYGFGEASAGFVRAPLLVVNCALNMVGESDNAVQERKAASFTFTPLHAGCPRLGYRPVHQYGGPDGVTLGTAMTISGAAVSPNAGYRSTPAMTFLMTLFNARLGWWLGNPERADASGESGPTQSAEALVRELLGRTHSAGKWIYLSDGGHFENLGVYEMVRRGCRYIVVSDASADPGRSFDDLGNAIRKIRIDLGIEIRQKEIFQIGGRDLAEDGRYAALFDIVYPWSDEAFGQLLYVKSAIYRANDLNAPIDVMEYGSRSPDFPHEPTSDQFFMETQFESYRALGEHEMAAVMLQPQFADHVPGLFSGAVEHIRAPFEEDVEK